MIVLHEKKWGVSCKNDREDNCWYLTRNVPNVMPQSKLTERNIPRVPTLKIMK